VNYGDDVDAASNITNRILEADFRWHYREWNWPSSFYTEQHFEDCCGLGNVFKRSHSYTFGVLTSLGRDRRADQVRIEYTKIAHKALYHPTWFSGWTNDGRLMSHPSGRDSQMASFIWTHYFESQWRSELFGFWQAKDRIGRVDRHWIREFNPAFQKSEFRMGMIPRMIFSFSREVEWEVAGSLSRVLNKYSFADHHTWEFGVYSSASVNF
jgi:hypothetical protein